MADAEMNMVAQENLMNLIDKVYAALSAADRLGELAAATHLNEALIGLGCEGMPPPKIRYRHIDASAS